MEWREETCGITKLKVLDLPLLFVKGTENDCTTGVQYPKFTEYRIAWAFDQTRPIQFDLAKREPATTDVAWLTLEDVASFH